MEQHPPSPAIAPLDGARPDMLQDITRRKFLGTLTGALAAGIMVQILGCTTDPLSPETAGTGNNGCPQPGGLGKVAATSSRTATVGANHGHTAVLTPANQDAAAAFTLHIEGTAGHDHTVNLTAKEMCDLKAGLALTRTSSNVNAHTHTITFALVTSPTATRNGDVGDNHGHAAAVTGVVQDSATAYSLHIEGDAGHDHVLLLTANEVATLKAGGTVSGVTEDDGTGHSHPVTFTGVTAILPVC